jgi:hypothetical protein
LVVGIYLTKQIDVRYTKRYIERRTGERKRRDAVMRKVVEGRRGEGLLLIRVRLRRCGQKANVKGVAYVEDVKSRELSESETVGVVEEA